MQHDFVKQIEYYFIISRSIRYLHVVRILTARRRHRSVGAHAANVKWLLRNCTRVNSNLTHNFS